MWYRVSRSSSVLSNTQIGRERTQKLEQALNVNDQIFI